MVSFACARTDPNIVVAAAFMTGAMVFGLTLYAMTTKSDLSVLISLVFIIATTFLMMGLFFLITNNKIINLIYCSLGVILFGLYLVIDVKMIMGGNGIALGLDEYILAALVIYMDIILIFLFLIRLLTEANR